MPLDKLQFVHSIALLSTASFALLRNFKNYLYTLPTAALDANVVDNHVMNPQLHFELPLLRMTSMYHSEYKFF